MIVFIWRGIGIIVPILLFGIGYICSLFYEDKRLGNTDLMGWTLFYSCILFLLIGLAVGLPSEEEKEKGMKFKWNNHTFFYIPILIWGIIAMVFSIYFLMIYNPNAVDDSVDFQTNQTESTEDKKTKIHFYNPTEDSLIYYTYDEYGTDEAVKLAGYTSEMIYTSGEENQANYIGATTFDDTFTLNILPEDFKKYDQTKFVKIKEEGKEYFLRKIKQATAATNDVDDIWVLLDENYHLALIDVSEIYSSGKINRNSIEKINWLSKVKEKYQGNDIIEVNVKYPDKNGKIKMIGPNFEFPVTIEGETKVYFLLDYLNDEDLTKAYITKEIMRLSEPD
jgi:hypothetical protein